MSDSDEAVAPTFGTKLAVFHHTVFDQASHASAEVYLPGAATTRSWLRFRGGYHGSGHCRMEL